MPPAVLRPIDLLVLASILGLVFVTGIVVSWSSRNQAHSSDYFLGGRQMAWWAIGGSLFASNIGTEHFVGMAGSGAASGLPVSLYEWTAGWLLVLLGEVFAPVYLRARVTTIPEFCERRFGPGTRVLVSSISLIAVIVTKISASIFAGGILLRVVAGWELWTSVPIIILTTGLYTIGGGLQAVMYTDVLQAVIFVGGGLAGLAIAMRRTGGWSGMRETLGSAGLESHLHLLRPPDDASNPTTGIFSGLLVASVWYWCVDQVIVQRVLSARSVAHARAGCVLAGYFKLLPPFMIVLPGIAARVLFERCRLDGVGAEDPAGWCSTRLDEPQASNAAYLELIVREFPPGMVGLLVAAMVCAMMSSLSSSFNSASTILTVDIFHRFVRPGATERELLWCGRSATALTCGLSLAWLPVVERQRGEFYQIVQNASTHLAPSLATVVTLGITWRRVNASGAFAGVLVGALLGLAQYGLALAREDECRAATVGTTLGGPPLACMHFLHMAVLLAAVTLLVTVTVSLLTPPPPSSALVDTMVQCRGCCAKPRPSDSTHVQMFDHADEGEVPSSAAAKPAAGDAGTQLSRAPIADNQCQPLELEGPCGDPVSSAESHKRRATADSTDFIDSAFGQKCAHYAGALLVVIVLGLCVLFA